MAIKGVNGNQTSKVDFKSKLVNNINNSNIRTSLFINPSITNIKIAKKIGTNCIEIHTGKIANLVKKKIALKIFYQNRAGNFR